MSTMLSRAALAALIALGVPACDEEPTAPALSLAAVDDAAPAVVEGSPADRRAIRDIVRTFDEAWTAGDAVRYAAQYAGADWVGPDGTVLTDPAAITELYTIIFTLALPNTTRNSYIRNLTFLSERIAVLDIDTRVRGFTAPPPGVVPWRPGVLRALEKNVLVKRRGEWRIVQHQQTLLAPEQ